jgi:hypothetical protein
MQPLLTLAGLTLGEGHNDNLHLHGGPPAPVGSIELRLEASSPHSVSGQGLVLLHAHCREPEGSWPDRKALSIVETWWTADGQQPQKLVAPLALAAGARGALHFTFAREELYQSCDLWAVDVALLVDGEPRTVRVPLPVTRIEPAPR